MLEEGSVTEFDKKNHPAVLAKVQIRRGCSSFDHTHVSLLYGISILFISFFFKLAITYIRNLYGISCQMFEYFMLNVFQFFMHFVEDLISEFYFSRFCEITAT
jgi:hypothetical protein